jgi:hypothetical protein
MCCGLFYLQSAMKTPSEAEKLSEEESKSYVDQLQGLWDVIAMEQPDMGMWNGQHTMGFTRVFVSGDKMAFSGGPGGRTQLQTISVHRTPEGVIYLDDKGSVLDKFAPQEGVVEVTNALGFRIGWKKSGDAPTTTQP